MEVSPSCPSVTRPYCSCSDFPPSIITAHVAMHPLDVQGNASSGALHDAALLSLQIFGCVTGVLPSAANTSGKVPSTLANSLSRLATRPMSPRPDAVRTSPHAKSPLEGDVTTPSANLLAALCAEAEFDESSSDEPAVSGEPSGSGEAAPSAHDAPVSRPLLQQQYAAAKYRTISTQILGHISLAVFTRQGSFI